MAMLRKLAPQFIDEGRLMWLKAPLIRVEKGKQKHYFYSNEEYEKAGVSGVVTFYKGLGQMDPVDLKESMFNEKNQRFEKIVPSEEGIAQLEQLMGDVVLFRKEFVSTIDFSTFTPD